jgi:hypothetical protein
MFCTQCKIPRLQWGPMHLVNNITRGAVLWQSRPYSCCRHTLLPPLRNEQTNAYNWLSETRNKASEISFMWYKRSGWLPITFPWSNCVQTRLWWPSACQRSDEDSDTITVQSRVTLSALGTAICGLRLQMHLVTRQLMPPVEGRSYDCGQLKKK